MNARRSRGKLPQRVCPHCGSQVLKVIRYSQLSYECTKLACGHWGPWDVLADFKARGPRKSKPPRPCMCPACIVNAPRDMVKLWVPPVLDTVTVED